MNAHKLERIKERRAELKSAHSEDSGLSLLEFTIEKLISAEERIGQLESYVSALAESAPTSGAALYLEHEHYNYTEQFRVMGKEAKKLLPNEYRAIEDKS